MREQAYELLEDCMEDEPDILFDIKNSKESVVFDYVECHNTKELDKALELRIDGKSVEEPKKAIQG